MSSTKLFSLQSHLCLLANHCFYQFCFMTHDHYLPGSPCCISSIKYMLQHRFSANFM